MLWLSVAALLWLLLLSLFVVEISCGGPGAEASDSGVAETSDGLHFQVNNHFLWSVTKGSVTNPPFTTVEQWVTQLSEVLKVTINCSQIIYKKLVQRVAFLKRKSQQLKGGRQRKKFFDSNWTLIVGREDILSFQKVVQENTELKEQVKQLSSQLESATQVETTKKSMKRKAESECTGRHQRRLKKQRAEDCSSSLSWMAKDGLKPVQVLAVNTKTNKTEAIVLSQLGEILGGEPTQDESDTIDMMLFVKDRFAVSGQGYHEMSKICKQMPRSYKVKTRIAELNDLWNIFPTPNGVVGVQQSLEESLKKRARTLISNTPDDTPFKTNKRLRVKLSGDGTCIGKRLHVTNFTYTLLDEGEKAHSFEGNHPLALFRSPEHYDSLKQACVRVRVCVHACASFHCTSCMSTWS